MTLLEIRNLTVRYRAGGAAALDNVDLCLDTGQALSIVGETGAGKSTLAHSLVGLVQPPQSSGSIRIDGVELVGASTPVLRELQWSRVAIAIQGSPFNPVATVGAQIIEPALDRQAGRSAAWRRAVEVAEELGLDPGLLDRHPHQLSGGERKRAAIAMAMVLEPELLVLDEPTAGLDPPARLELLEWLTVLRADRRTALVTITHDLAAAAQLGDHVLVLYGGQPMELGRAQAVVTEARHPYTWALVNTYPLLTTTKDLRPIRGRSPDGRSIITGCPFHPRCNQAQPVCTDTEVRLEPVADRRLACHLGGITTVLEARDVHHRYPGSDNPGTDNTAALASVSLHVRPGEAIGIVGPSGSGKTTLARILSGDLVPEAGQVLLDGVALSTSWRRADRRRRATVQLVRQDPWDALSPRQTVVDIVGEPLVDTTPDSARHEAVLDALAEVGLATSGPFLASRTHELSGGQLQRVALARAIVSRPRVVVADEPTAMLDASEQARLLVVLRQAQVAHGMALVLVSHDLGIVRKVTDRIIVLDRGRIVEAGPSEIVSTRPVSATARRLLAAAPRLDPNDPDQEPG